MFGLMYVCVCLNATNTCNSTEAKGRAVHQVRFGSRFLVSSHGHNQVPPSLPLFHLLSHSLSLSPACACVSVVCDLVPEVSVSVCPSGLTLTEQWSGKWQRDRLSRSWARGKAAAASINFRFAFQSTAKRVNLTDFSADTRHQVSASICDDQTSLYAVIVYAAFSGNSFLLIYICRDDVS